MKLVRAILITFLGNYLINNVVAAIAAFIPAGTGTFTAQYIVFIVLAAIVAGLLTWWYFGRRRAGDGLKVGLLFGIVGFIVSIVVAFITGVSGVLVQTASFTTLWSVLPNFGPFLWNWSTLVLLGYWVIPGVFVGWLVSRGRGSAAQSPAAGMTMPQRPM